MMLNPQLPHDEDKTTHGAINDARDKNCRISNSFECRLVLPHIPLQISTTVAIVASSR
jgi:hypothetical protein